MSLRLILHGRATCAARSPKCGQCILADICPSVAIGSAPAKLRSSATAKKADKAPSRA
jgi:adenine-specific DNA glycosylase